MPREFYSAGEAARTLGISLDTLRRWDRQGRIKTRRDSSNRRIVAAKEIERLRGGAAPSIRSVRATASAASSARSGSRGLMAQVEMVVTEPRVLTAIVTADSVEELGIKAGNHIVAVIKSTSVMVEHEKAGSARTHISALVAHVVALAVLAAAAAAGRARLPASPRRSPSTRPRR